MVTKPRLARAAPDDRRENILGVARKAFVAHGFAGTSMSVIAAQVGGSKATLYKYFPSKESLFEAVIERDCAEVRRPLHGLDSAPDDLPALLRAVGGRVLCVIYQPDSIALYRIVQAESLRFPSLARTFFAAGPEKVHRTLADALAVLAARGVIACPDPLLTAQQFLAMLKGDRHMRVICGVAAAPEPATIAAQLDHAVALLAAALTVAPAAKRVAARRG